MIFLLKVIVKRKTLCFRVTSAEKEGTREGELAKDKEEKAEAGEVSPVRYAKF